MGLTIATEAGVSLGSAYYYFDGKDAPVQELYSRIQAEHRERAVPLLIKGAPLGTNLSKVLYTGLDTMAPYHSFGTTMLHIALSRTSAVSPFSAESAPPRVAATALIAQTLAASRGARGGFAPDLPHLLWMAYLAVTLHWVMDASPDQRRTRELVEGLTPILARAVTLSGCRRGAGWPPTCSPSSTASPRPTGSIHEHD